MKNLREKEQSVSPSDIRRALPVSEISEEKISDVLDGLICCFENRNCEHCPYMRCSGVSCANDLGADARKVIEYLKSVRKEKYRTPTVSVIKGE